jgi:hypothetical protein
LARIKTMAAANRYLKDHFVPDYNARFAVPAAEPSSAFVPYVGRPLTDVLCLQEDRVVGADNCVSYHRRSLQIPPQHHRQHAAENPESLRRSMPSWLDASTCKSKTCFRKKTRLDEAHEIHSYPGAAGLPPRT